MIDASMGPSSSLFRRVSIHSGSLENASELLFAISQRFLLPNEDPSHRTGEMGLGRPHAPYVCEEGFELSRGQGEP